MIRTIKIYGAFFLASFIFAGCGGGKSESDKTSSDSIKKEVIAKKSDSANAKPETKTSKNCNVNISKSYTDYWVDSESGDMGGSVQITFIKLSDGNYDAQIEQRYGTEGGTYPLQKVNNLYIDEKGNITFEVKWFTDSFGNKSKTKTIKAKGVITKNILKFKTDIPNSPEYILK